VQQRQPPEALRERLMSSVREEAAQAEGAPQRARVPDREPAWRRWTLSAWRPATALAAAAVLAGAGVVGYAIGTGGEPSQTVEPTVTSSEIIPLGGSQASGTLERRDDSAMLLVDELPRLAEDKVYEVWIDRRGQLEPSTLFVLDERRHGAAAIPGPLDDADQILVTAEPRRGSETPTGAPLLKARL
jgi:hypothetical protein